MITQKYIRNVDTNQDYWHEEISPNHSVFHVNFREIWKYRDLLMIWIRRDILSLYSQTILGPLWFLIQPLLTTIAYMIIFTRIARLSTGGIPPIIFFMSGIILWNYFSECIIKTSSFLKDNAGLFSKVYFPRLIIPLSLVLTNLVKFIIQFCLFISVYLYYTNGTGTIHPTHILWLTLPILLVIASLSFGIGMIVSSLTTKYKDLSHLIIFSIQLLLFLSPVFYSVSGMENGIYKKIILSNPMTGLIEAFRYGFTGKGYFSWELIGYDVFVAVACIIIGLILFNTVEKSFVDTI